MCVFAPSAAAAVLETAAFILCYHGLHPLATCTENITLFVGRKCTMEVLTAQQRRGRSFLIPSCSPAEDLSTLKRPQRSGAACLFLHHHSPTNEDAHMEHGKLKRHTCLLSWKPKGAADSPASVQLGKSAWHAFRGRTRMRRNLAAINRPCFHSLPCQR